MAEIFQIPIPPMKVPVPEETPVAPLPETPRPTRRDSMIDFAVKHIDAFYGEPCAEALRPLLVSELGTLWDEAQTLTPHGQTRLEIAAEIIEATLKYDRESCGSYRSYIYGYLGFGPSAYGPLYEAGGMAYTNSADGGLVP